MHMPRLVLLGLDAGDKDYIQSRASALPCLQKHLRSGRLFTLDAPKALSGSVWPTFYNGTDPGVHGIYQHLVWDARRMGVRRIGADWCYYRPFWQEIEEAGHHVIVLDVPYSFPVALKQGIEITDWGTHGQTFPVASNRNGVQTLLNRIGKSPIGRETPIQKTSKELHTIHQQLIKSAEVKGQLIMELAGMPDWDVLLAVFAETHRGGHIFFSDDDEKPFDRVTPLLEIYQAVDRALARIIDQVDDETTVVIFSAHGMMRDYAQGHLVRPLMKKINEVFLETHSHIPPKRPWKANSLIPYLRKVVPPRLQYAIGASSPDVVRQWVVEKEMIGGLDWSVTPAFALRTDIRTEIRLNLAGRESQGMLKPHSELHDAYVNFMKNVFLELRDRETDARLVDEVVDTHHIFPGARNALLPDFVITWHPRPFVKRAYSPLVGDLTSAQLPGARGGDHTDYGFAIVPHSMADLHPLQHITDLAGWSKRFVNGAR
jgi:predicted AlkP superfamily phosphohydrolase/phosphomutase